MTRKNISKRLRFEVLRRDGFVCRYCGRRGPDTGEGLTVDHVVPVVLGGSDDPSNLVACCKDCNSGKTSTSPTETEVAQVADDAVRWAAAMHQAVAERLAQHAVIAEAVRAVDEEWSGWTIGGSAVPRDEDWDDTVARFVAAGLPVEDLLRFVAVAMRSRASASSTWAYYCGCCWSGIRELKERASELVSGRPADDTPQAADDGVVMVDGYNAMFSAGMHLYRAGVFDEEAVEVATGYLEAEMDEMVACGFLDGWRYERDYGRHRKT